MKSVLDAANSGNVERLMELLQHTPSGISCTHMLTADSETALHLAARNGHVDIVRALHTLFPDDWTQLVQMKAEGSTWSAFREAARYDHGNVIRTLIDLTPNWRELDLRAELGRSPWHIACCFGSLSVVKAFMETAEDVGEFLKAVDSEGNTGLHLAAFFGKVDLALVMQEADPKGWLALVQMKTEAGQAPLHNACFKGHANMVRALCSSVIDSSVLLNQGDNQNRLPLDLALEFRVPNASELARAAWGATQQKEFIWKIPLEQIEKLVKGDVLKSEVFSLGDDADFRLDFYPKGNDKSRDGRCRCSIKAVRCAMADSGHTTSVLMEVHMNDTSLFFKRKADGRTSWTEGYSRHSGNFFDVPTGEVTLKIVRLG
jgi:ankyrin repeat protein